MKLYPAIDLRGGQAVRLYQGDYDRMTVYNADPSPRRSNLSTQVRSICMSSIWTVPRTTPQPICRRLPPLPSWAASKSRSAAASATRHVSKRYLDLGADRCILGTVAVKNFDFTAEIAQKYGAQIAVGVDMKDGAVAVNGWKEVTPEPGVAFCRRCANAGVKAIIATDISRDGTMQGTNMALYRELLTIPCIEVTASGGIAAMAELAELSAMHCHAAILGKSIYTGAIDLAEAVRLYESK